MNKVIGVTINGVAFSIEEDAYGILKNYLDAINRRFVNDQEVIRDIESSIAEKFSEMLNTKKQTVIMTPDVNELIKVMGRAEDIADENAPDTKKETPTESSPVGPKRLYRDMDNAILAGVCSGLAKYAGIDPVFVRALFILLVFANGIGLLAYLVLWLIVPQAKTSAQKLEMQGEPATLSRIKEFAAEKAREIQTERVTGQLREIVQVFAKVLAALVGAGLLIAAIAGIAGITVAGVGFAVTAANPSSFPFQIANLLSDPAYFIMLFSAYFVVIIPLIFILFAGISLLRGRRVGGAGSLVVLLFVWFAAIAVIGVIGLRHEEKIRNFIDTQAAAEEASLGPVMEKKFVVADFNGVDANGIYTIQLRSGNTFSVVGNGHASLLDDMDVNVDSAKVLHIRQESGRHRWCFWSCPSRREQTQFIITSPELNSLRVDGLVNVEGNGITSKNLLIEADGISRVMLQDTLSTNVSVETDGTAQVFLSGNAKSLEAKLDGISKLQATAFVTDEANVDLDGASEARVAPLKQLIVDADGVSKVYYFGTPNISQNLDGAAKIFNFSTPPTSSLPVACVKSDMESFRICQEFMANNNYIPWSEAVRLINDCQVKSVTQAHSLEVSLLLRGGRSVRTVEPQIDDIMDEVQKNSDRCGKVIMATE